MITLYPKQRRQNLIGIGIGLMIIAFFTYQGFYYDHALANEIMVGFIRVFNLTVIPFFVVTTLLVIWRYLTIVPALVVDERGITDRISTIHIGLTPWSALAQVHFCHVGQTRTIALHFRDAETFTNNLSIHRWEQVQHQMQQGGGHINIDEKMCGNDFVAVCHMIQRYVPKGVAIQDNLQIGPAPTTTMDKVKNFLADDSYG